MKILINWLMTIGKTEWHMRKGVLSIILVCLVSIALYAQSKNFTKASAIGVHLSFTDFKGADSLPAFGRYAKTGLSLNYQNNISNRFSYSITLAGSFLEFRDQKNRDLGNGKRQLLLEADASLRTKLFTLNNRFQPYIQAGAGVSAYNSYYGIFIPAGMGCQVNLLPDVFLLINTQYRLPVTHTQYRHFFHSIGIAGTISRKKVMKTVQQQPLPLPVKIVQLADSDGDGIIDSADACPQVMGVIRYHGCPVPDRDGDGIHDDEDLCPDIKGIRERKGCPMPDQDHDGIEDAYDKCIDKAGTAANGGCPNIDMEIKKRVDEAAAQIFFETGRYRLLPKSYAALNDVIRVLINNPSLGLIIEGHTDNTGTPSGNQLLSENRAHAVRQYLINGGISASRLQPVGYGQQKPVSDNNTEQAKAKNRRVEFKLIQ